MLRDGEAIFPGREVFCGVEEEQPTVGSDRLRGYRCKGGHNSFQISLCDTVDVLIDVLVRAISRLPSSRDTGADTGIVSRLWTHKSG